MSTIVAPITFDESGGRAAPPPPPTTFSGRRFMRARKVLSIALTVAAFAVTWWYVAPPQLGGSTSFVTVDGTSMLPKLKKSDLIVLRPRHTYGVGDVVGYRSSLIHRVVLHRIVAIRHGRYSFKGDNNSFIDPEQPTRSDLVGGMWLHVPSAGQLILQLHRPPLAAAFAALLVLMVGLGGGTRRWRSS